MPAWHGRSRSACRLPNAWAVLALLGLSSAAGTWSTALVAQESQARDPPVHASPFRPLELRPPNAFRTAAGTPGPLYWQQRADYTIRASLDTATHVVHGDETIHYTNNSPDTLRFVWMQLDQNLGSSKNPLAIVSQRYSREDGFEGGYTIERVRELHSPSVSPPVDPQPLGHRIKGTLMHVYLDEPLPPHGTLLLDIGWRFQVPVYWRTGRERYPEGWLYQVGQWFPRMVVYDDVRGWNTEPYTGHGEFYLEYGSVDFSITAPAAYTVTGSGVLLNAQEVLSDGQRDRLALAAHSDTTVSIIGPEEIGSASLVPPGTGAVRTWRFRAERVRDVAWAAAPNFIWDAIGLDGVLVQALYPPEALPSWSRAAEEGREAIRTYSTMLGAYPYPTAILVNGPVRGMEYPMIAFCRSRTDVGDVVNCALHELGHQWFPMLVGSNERLYGWQDEGLVNFVEAAAWTRRFPEDTTWIRNLRAAFMLTWLYDYVRPGEYVMEPIEWDPNGVYFLHTSKSAVGLTLLRNQIVDSTAFDLGLREYVSRWTYRHPTPADFFRTMEAVVGEDLSWFWRSWFYRDDRLDIAVDSVVQRDTSDMVVATIYLSSRAEMVAPVVLLTGQDGSRRRIKLPVQIWYRGSRYAYRFNVPRGERPIRIELDPDHVFPDENRANDSWVLVDDPGGR